jgi:hypothetical protein
MTQWLRDLFSDSSSVSMTRFLSFICVMTATVIGFYGVYGARDVTAIVTIFLGAGLGAKVAQKSMELKTSGPKGDRAGSGAKDDGGAS